MLVWVRKLLENWIARVFFGLLVVVFVFWGVSNVVTLIGSNTAIAHVGGKPIDISAVQAVYQPKLEQAQQKSGQAVAPEQRQEIAQDALATVLRQQLLRDEEQKLGVNAPDAAIRQAIDSIPAFQTNGVFDSAKFNAVLSENGTNEDKFLADVRQNIAGRQMLTAVVSGAVPPAELVSQIFAFVAEQRVAETMSVPVAGQKTPPPPAPAVLERYWRNHPQDFTAPETRTVKLVILSPELLAPHEPVAAAAVDAAYARQAEAAPSLPERSAEVIVVGDIATESRLAASWRHGADWPAMQALAQKFGATTVPVDMAEPAQIPSPALSAAIFSATPGAVTGPVAGPGTMYLFKVTRTGSSGPDPATVKAQITQQLQLQQAQAEVAKNVDPLEDALAGQTPLDQLPSNLGLVGAEGTLDANGNKPDGTPAPIPGGDALKSAIVQAAFATAQGQPPSLVNGPDGSYFALEVEKITPPQAQPYDQVAQKVLAQWTRDALLREAEQKAAGVLAAVDHGESLDDAAAAAGYGVSMTAPFTRNAPPSGVTSQMEQVLFSLKPHEATMLQTDTGFMVAQLAQITLPSPAADAADETQVVQAMTKAVQQDVGESFLAGLQASEHVTVDAKMLAQVAQ